MQKKILIVEDDKDILFTIQELLESEGYSTSLAQNGLVALEALKAMEVLPDLILLDYMMPEMDGQAFKIEQKKNPIISQIPTLLMTADSQADLKQIQIGASGYIKKPIDLDTFLNIVQKHLS